MKNVIYIIDANININFTSVFSEVVSHFFLLENCACFKNHVVRIVGER